MWVYTDLQSMISTVSLYRLWHSSDVYWLSLVPGTNTVVTEHGRVVNVCLCLQVCEYGNLSIHIALRDLRPPG